jgi:hypothetical protein
MHEALHEAFGMKGTGTAASGITQAYDVSNDDKRHPDAGQNLAKRDRAVLGALALRSPTGAG